MLKCFPTYNSDKSLEKYIKILSIVVLNKQFLMQLL